MPFPPDKKERYFTYEDYLSWGDDVQCELIDGVIFTSTYPMKYKEGYFTYEDFLNFEDEVRYEIIDGNAYGLHAPSPIHQDISRELTLIIANFLKGKSCKMYYAPFIVRLNADTKDDIVLQPDIVVICDKSRQDKRSYKGAPKLVIEITSPATAHQDKSHKFEKYLQAKVPEYWIVDIVKRCVSVNKLKDEKYVTKIYEEKDKIISSVLEGCEIDLADVFPKKEIKQVKYGFHN